MGERLERIAPQFVSPFGLAVVAFIAVLALGGCVGLTAHDPDTCTGFGVPMQAWLMRTAVAAGLVARGVFHEMRSQAVAVWP